ncbi:MAG TPA: heme lyase NrfEFG subunit NrfF [Providencia sp.]|uniref:heme lyase NrfEFG subunit NrfF n=1 Tax=Providencia sp. TaxID=589 RepID=UPI000E884539|nr:heme lyase NrfEFG subunit NrfF [Providencia sp.]MBP6080836.1 heme lyase NrfEFG subunit NrfF [Providencia sp.]HBO21652.1 heme lyase NrfEFG subunit NrfF [Providencia sp.]
MFKFIYLLFFLSITFIAQAQIVDTWQFSSPEQQDYSLQIASQLRCPQCQNQNLLESNAPTAVSMRHQVFKMVEEGKSEPQIMTYMTDRYGDFVRYNPPLNNETLLLWALPPTAFIFIFFILWRTIKTKRLEHTGSPLTQIQANDTEQIIGTVTEKNSSLKGWNKKINLLLFTLLLCAIAGYLTLPRFQQAYHEYQRISDPLLSFSPLQQEQNDLLRLQQNIRQSPQNGELWATLGEYYLYQNSYENALLAYQKAIKYSGENAQLYSAIATVLYYQAGQNLTNDARAVIDKALSLDKNEVTALMLIASDAFMNANYEKAINIWQELLDSNSPRVNRAQLIEAIQMAKLINSNLKK